LIAILNVTDEHDLMIVNKSGIMIRMAVSDLRVMGRATQGVRLINLKGKDEIASVTKVIPSDDEDNEEYDENEEQDEDGTDDESPETGADSETPTED